MAEHLGKLEKHVVTTLTLYEDENDDHAAFFSLQRYLHKWGGEYLTKSSKEHIAYDFLFLHLYRKEVKGKYLDENFMKNWHRISKKEIESIAAYVRRSFYRTD